MDEKELKAIEVIYDNAAAVMRIPDVPLHEFYAVMTLAYKRIPALIKAIRDKPDCNCAVMLDIQNKFIEEIAELEQAVKDKDETIATLEHIEKELRAGKRIE